MPQVNTKYNYINKLQQNFTDCGIVDISRAYFLTLDTSDNFINNDQYKVYLNSRASYYIHPFSQVSNCQPNICRLDESRSNLICDNSNSLFNIKIPPRVPINNSSSISENHIQKQIQNIVGVKSSLYTNNLASLYVNEISGTLYKPWNNASDRLQPHGIKFKTEKSSLLPNYGIDIKHNSYDRYLARKKSQYVRTENDSGLLAKYGNKTYKLGIGSCIKNACPPIGPPPIPPPHYFINVQSWWPPQSVSLYGEISGNVVTGYVPTIYLKVGDIVTFNVTTTLDFTNNSFALSKAPAAFLTIAFTIMNSSYEPIFKVQENMTESFTWQAPLSGTYYYGSYPGDEQRSRQEYIWSNAYFSGPPGMPSPSSHPSYGSIIVTE